MKKFTFLLIFFIFLTGVAWGQTEYTYNGWTGAPWASNASWLPNTGYPMDGDSVIFPNANGATIPDGLKLNEVSITYVGQYQLTVATGGTVTIEKLTVIEGATLQPLGVSSTLLVKEFILNGSINNTTNGYNLSVDNIVVGSNANVLNNPISMGNGTTVAISSGNIIINIPDNLGSVNLGNITTSGSGNVTINAGTGNNVNIGNIDAGGSVTINPGAGTTVGVESVESNPPYNPPSGVTVGGNDTSDNRHLVFGRGSALSGYSDTTQYNVIDLDAPPVPFETNLHVNSDKNIIIVDVGTFNDHPMTFSIRNASTQTGHIEIIGSYISNSSLTLYPRDGGVILNINVVLNSSNVEIHGNISGTGTLTNNGTLDIGGHNISTTGTITNNGTLRLTGAGSQTINQSAIGGTVEFNNSGTTLAGIEQFNNIKIINGSRSTTALTVDGAAEIGSNVTTTGDQEYKTTLTLTGTVTLEGASILTGAITGGSNNLTLISADATITSGTGINTLTINGTAETNGNLSATTLTTANAASTLTLGTHNLTAGTINNSGTIRLTGITGQTVSPITTTSGTVEFYGNESGFAGLNTFYNLRIIAGARTTTALTVNGAATIGSNVTTTGDQDYKTTLTLTGAVTLMGASISTGAITGGSNNLTLISDDTTIASGTGINTLTINGTAETNGNLSVTTLTIANAASTLTLGAHNLTASTITNNGTIRLTGAASQTVSPITATSGTVEFYNNESGFAGLNTFNNLTINVGARVAPATLTVSGTWNVNAPGSFVHNNGTVDFSNGAVVNSNNTFNTVSIASGATVTFNGNNTIATLNATGSTVRFAGGSTQTINTLSAIGATLTAAPVAAHWFLTTPAAFTKTTDNTTNISWCDATSRPLNWTVGTDAADGDNNINVFNYTYTWTGSTSTAWAAPGNWDKGIAPDSNKAIIIIPTVLSNYPILSADVICASLTIANGAVLDVRDFDVTGTLTNNGTIKLNGVASQSIPSSALTGTIHYHNENTPPATNVGNWVLGTTYNNLIVGSSVTMVPAASLTINDSAVIGSVLNITDNLTIGNSASLTTSANITVGGNLSVGSSASFAMGSHTLAIGILTNSGTLTTSGNVNVSGNSWNNTGTFTASNPSMVTFSNSITTVSGNNTFYNVTVEEDCIVQFPNGSEQTVLHFLYLEQRSTIRAVTSVLGFYWKLFGGKIVPYATTTTDDLSNIEDCDADSHHNFIAFPELNAHAKSNNNNHNIFLNIGDIVYTWTGATSSAWDVSTNWTSNTVPLNAEASIIIIPEVLSNNYPVLIGNVICGSLEIEDEDAEIDLKGFTLEVEHGLINKGTIKLFGTTANQVTAGEPFSTTTGIIHYYNDSPSPPHAANWVFGTTYHDLIVDSTVTMDTAGTLVADNVEISSNITASSLTVTGTSDINADIITTGNQTYTGTVTLGGSGTHALTGVTVTFGGEVVGGINGLSIAGNAVFGNVVNAASISVSGTSTINADITTTGNQNYTGNVTLGGSGTRTFTGATVTFGGAVAGVSHGLIVTGDAVFGNAVNAASVSVSGTSTINADITTTSGQQTYTGNVTLGGSGTHTLTGTTVTFGGAVAGGIHGLSITGDAVFVNVVNAASVSVSGSSTINADITTTGNQTYTGTVTLGGSGDRILTGATVTFNNTVEGGGKNLNIDGNSVFNYGVDNIVNLEITGTSALNANVTNITTSGSQAYGGVVTLNGTTARTLSAVGTFNTNGFTVSSNALLTIEASDDITIDGTTNTSGIITIKTINDTDAIDVNINGSINAQRLIVDAPGTDETNGATVSVADTAEIIVSNNGDHHSSPGDGTNAAIYMDVNNFTAFSGIGGIIPGTSGQFCISAYTFDHANRVSGNRYHHHQKIKAGTHLIFAPVRPADEGTFLFSNTALYSFVDSITATADEYSVSADRNIFLMNNASGDINPALDELIFITSGNGKIYIWNEFVFDGSLSLEIKNNTTGNIHLWDAEIELTESFNTDGLELELDGTSGLNEIKAPSVTLDTIKGNSRSLTITVDAGEVAILNDGSDIDALLINGNARFNEDMITDIHSVSVTGDTEIFANITTTGAGNFQSYAVTAGAAITLGGSGNRTFAGATVTFGGAVAGVSHGLIVTGNAEFNNDVNTASVSVSGNSTIDADITTTSGQQNYTGTVTLGSGSTHHVLTGTIVTFGNDVTGSNTNLIINGNTNINTDVTTTSGQQTYAGTVTLSGSGTSVLTGTTVTFIGAVTGGDVKSLRIDGDAEFNSNANASAIIDLEVTGESTLDANIQITTSGKQDYGNIITLTGNAELSADGTIDTNGFIVPANALLTIASSSDITIAGNINTESTQDGIITIRAIDDTVTINININGSIYVERLIILAPGTDQIADNGGIVTVDAAAEIRVKDTGWHETPLENGSPGDGTNAAIFMHVFNFIANPDTVSEIIYPGATGTNGHFCISSYYFTPNGRVDGDRYHHHQKIKSGKNLVFAPNVKVFPDTPEAPDHMPGIDFNDNNVFQWIDSTVTLAEIFTVSEDKDIYLVDNDAGKIRSELSALTFTTSGIGKIYIWNGFVFSRALTLNTDSTTGGIYLKDADINLTGTNYSFTVNGAAIYMEDGTESNITTTANISILDVKVNAGTQSLTLTADNTVTLNGNTAINGSLNVTADNTVTLNGNSVINGSLNVTADNLITLDGIYNIAGDAELKAKDITLNCDVNLTGTGNMTINNSGDFTLAAGSDLVLSGSFNQTGTGGSTALSGNITTTGTGSITFKDVVTILSGEININDPDPYLPGDEVITIISSVNLTTAGGDIDFGQEIIGGVDASNKLEGVLVLDAGTAGNIDIKKPIGYNLASNTHAYLEYFEVKDGKLIFREDVFAVNMLFHNDFDTQSLLDPEKYIMFSVPKDTGGTIKIIEKHGGKLTISGGTYNTENHGFNALDLFQGINSEFEDVRIEKSSYIRVNQLSVVKGATLTLVPGDPNTETTLDLTAMPQLLDKWEPLNKLVLRGVSKEESSRVIIKEDTSLFLSEFNYETDGWAYIQTTEKDVVINITDPVIKNNIKKPELILEIQGATETLKAEDISIGSLHIYSDITLLSDLIINGELKIDQRGKATGVLNAGTHNITMYAGLSGKRDINDYTHAEVNNIKYARWELIRDSDPPVDSSDDPSYDMNDYPFIQSSSGKVIFDRIDPNDENVFFEIIGSTIWQDFECKVPGAIMQFSKHPYHHIFLGDFVIQGSENKHITLTRYLEDTSGRYKYKNDTTVPPGVSGNVDTSLPNYPISKDLKHDKIDSQRDKFWNFNFFGKEEIKNTDIYFSHAWNQRMPILRAGLNILPYFRLGLGSDLNKGHFNYDWGIDYHTVIYSFAEDADGNGKVDRIRVQSNVVLNGNFDIFDIKVEGYEVKDYQLVSKKLNSSIVDDEMEFYINLHEQPSIYDGKPLTWWIDNNYSLRDNVTEDILIGDNDNSGKFSPPYPYKTTNTIPPRISYALTLPGHNQTFFRFSQPVDIEKGGNIGGNAASLPGIIDRSETNDEVIEYPGTGNQTITINGKQGALSYLFNIDTYPSVEELAALPPVGELPQDASDFIHFTAEGYEGISTRALDWNDELLDPEQFIYYPSPRYPKDWNYSAYEKYMGNTGIKNEKGESLTQDDDPSLRNNIFVPPFKALMPGMIKRLVDYAAGEINIEKVTPQDFNGSYPEYEDEIKRRSTDILVSIAQTSEADNRYFALPVWAMHAMQPGSDGTTERNTIVRDFDGSKYFEARGNIDLQARMNPIFPGTLDLFWTNKIDTEMRNPEEAPTRGKNTGGLWQPDLTDLGEADPLYSVPLRLASISQGQVTAPAASSVPGNSQLFNYTISGNLESGDKLEFIFRINDNTSNPSNMFISCLDIPNGAEIPGDWYKCLRPFSVDIQDLRLQRGGVTIMNNVINSDKKEHTYLRYHLVRPGRVTIQVYTLDGSLVKSIRRNEQRAAGEWVDTWDGTNNGGRSVARGMYFIRVVGPDIDEIRKVMVVK